MSDLSTLSDSVLNDLRRHAFVPPDLDTFLAPLRQEVDALSEPYRSAGQAFAHNLKAVVETSALPFTFASTNAHDLHWQRTFLAERIRARGIAPEQGESDDSPSLEQRRDEHARNAARDKFQEFLKSDQGRNVLTRNVSQ